MMADGLSQNSAKADIFSSGQRELLADNLNPRNVKTLTSGSKASYIEGWHAINEANRIFGFGAWDREVVRLERTNCDLVDVSRNNRTEKQWRVGYLATVRVTVHGEDGSRHRDGTGFGSGYGKDNQLGEAIESAAKEAETDAMKRALSTFGNQFGLALYDKAKANVGPSQLEDQEPDAEQRETPETEAGAGPSRSAPVQTMSKGDARPDHIAMVQEIRACTTLEELSDWGKKNAKRAELQPQKFKLELRREYGEKLDALHYMADSARDANRVYDEEITP